MKFQVFGLLLCIAISVHGRIGRAVHSHNYRYGTDDYQHFPNIGYYKLYAEEATWGQAWKQCKNDGGHLVVIDSGEEYEVVRELQSRHTEHVYIGMHDLFKEGSYLTVTGEDFVPSDFLQWDEGQPDNYYDEDCIMLKENGLLNDNHCRLGNYFICELYEDTSYNITPR